MSAITRYALVKVRLPAGRPRDRSASRGHTTARGSGDLNSSPASGKRELIVARGSDPGTRGTRQVPRGSYRAPAPRGSRSTRFLLRKEVIQPHLPVRLPCYDFTPITDPTLGGSLPFGLGHRLRVKPALVV